MLYLFYHNPHSPYGFYATPIYSYEVGVWKQLMSGRITRYNPYHKSYITGSRAPSSIIVKRPNYLVLESPRGLLSVKQVLYPALYDAWRAGKLHDFTLADYPELLV